MKNIFRFLAVCCLFLMALYSAHAGIYLKVESPNVDGDSLATGYVNQIDVSSYQLSSSVPVTVSGSGLQTGLPQSSAIMLTKLLDKSSVTLLYNLHPGQHYGKMTFSFVSTGSTSLQLYYSVYLEDVVVSSFSSSSGGDRPAESISLNFRRIRWTYYPTPGSTTGMVQKGWDYSTNTSF